MLEDNAKRGAKTEPGLAQLTDRDRTWVIDRDDAEASQDTTLIGLPPTPQGQAVPMPPGS